MGGRGCRYAWFEGKEGTETKLGWGEDKTVKTLPDTTSKAFVKKLYLYQTEERGKLLASKKKKNV